MRWYDKHFERDLETNIKPSRDMIVKCLLEKTVFCYLSSVWTENLYCNLKGLTQLTTTEPANEFVAAKISRFFYF